MRTPVRVLLVVGLVACGDNLRPQGAGGDDDDGAATDAETTGGGNDADPGDAASDDGAVSTPDSRPGDGGGTPDGVGGGGVTCGTSTCTPGQVCCVNLGGSTCVAAGTCLGTTVACDGPEDCTTAGQVCCAALGGTTCSAENLCLAEVCHVDGDCDQGEECCGPMTAPRVCRNVCPGPPN